MPLSTVAVVADSSHLPKVSVIGTTYNHERFIERSIESALAQYYPNLEFIWVDDGSTDATPQLAEKYRDRITYVYKPNGGVISAVNRLYEEVTGDYIIVCGGDDELPADALIAERVRYLEAHPEVGLVYSDMEVIDDDSNVINESWMKLANISSPLSGVLLSEMMKQNCVGWGSVMFRSSLIPLFWPIPESVGFEDSWTLACISAAAEIHYIPGITQRYRKHDANSNLGARGLQLAHQTMLEIRLRRSMLAADFADQADLPSVVYARDKIVGIFNFMRRLTDDPYYLPVEEDKSAEYAAAARQALLDRDLERAARLACKSSAFAPLLKESMRVFADIADISTLREGGLGEETKRVVVAARAQDLLADESLLATYGQTFTAADDVTLVISAQPGDLEAFEACAERAGFTDDSAADVLVVTDISDPHLAACADAAFGGSWDTTVIRVYGLADIERMRQELLNSAIAA